MSETRKSLENKGYTFTIREEPVTEPGATATNYYVVTVEHHGDKLGTRSELTREGAMERALIFAEKHSRGEEPRHLMV